MELISQHLLSRVVVRRICYRLCLLSVVTALAACSIAGYHGTRVADSSFLNRAIEQQQDDLIVSVAVPDAEEARALTGLDLYAQGIQPIWVKIENKGATKSRVALWSIDRDYFAPIEVAYMNRKKFSSAGYQDMERWFYDNSLQREIPPGESRSGLVFTHVRPGTKGFNLDVFSAGTMQDFIFFVPLPGFTADFMEVDFDGLYEEAEIRELTVEELQLALETDLSCCASNSDETLAGVPFNVVLVGSGPTVRRSLLRGEWLETASGPGVADRARSQRYQGRAPDAIFSRTRADGNEKIQLHLWMAPWRVDGEPVWVGQVIYWTKDTSLYGKLTESTTDQDPTFLAFLARESVTADIDGAQRYLLQNFWYNGSVLQVGFVSGVGKATVDEPRQSFGGLTYITNGRRLVIFLSEEAVGLDDGEIIYDWWSSSEVNASQLFQGVQVTAPSDRLYAQDDGDLTVTTSVPSAKETKRVFGYDLYAKNIQPVWVQVENRGEESLYLTPMGLDSDYFTAREAANRSRASDEQSHHAPKLEKHAMTRLVVAPGSIQSGYIFSRVDEGTKSFNVDVIGGGSPHLMTFFVPVPGLKLDHYEVDIPGLYPESELKHVNLEQLVTELEALPCCVRDAKGKDKGDPLNLVMVGEIDDLYYGFMRAGWDETETIHGGSLFKTAASALSGGRYRYSPVSALYVFDRPQDFAMQRARSSINERNHLRVWLTPLRFDGKPVWIGQISRDIGVHFTWRTITTHKIDPNIDETREFLLEDLAYAQAIERFGYVGGTGEAPYEEPRGNLTGDPYFTDGRRMLMWIASEPTALTEIEVLDLSTHQTGTSSD